MRTTIELGVDQPNVNVGSKQHSQHLEPKDSWFKSTKKKALEIVEQSQMWAQKQKLYQMISGLTEFGNQDNYNQMIFEISKIFICIYVIFGLLARSIFIDFVDPFVPFISQYWMIRKQDEVECGGLKESQLQIINYTYLAIYNVLTIVFMIVLIIEYRDDFKQQLDWFKQYLKLKTEIAQSEYQKIYGKVNNDLKAQKQGMKQIDVQDDNANRLNINNNNDNQQLVNNQQQQPQNLQEIQNRLNQLKDKSTTTKYQQLNELNNEQIKQKFNYIRVPSGLMSIISTARMDLDLLSDSMAVASCYVLSQSMNLSQEIRNDLTLYYNCSLVILIVSLVPKYICWVYLILHLICKCIGIVHEDGKRLYEQNGCFGKLMFHIYRYIAKFYGMNYAKELEYKVNIDSGSTSMVRLWFINHEDMFIADQANDSFDLCAQLRYDVMERQIHPSLKVAMFRTIFENIPQLILQYSMVSALQRSNVEDCKKTNTAFQLSIIMTIINMVLGFIIIFNQAIKRLIGGDLVQQAMKSTFRKYLEKLKLKYIENEIVIDGQYISIEGGNNTTAIQVWPKMIESLYDFLIQNTQYTQIVFRDNKDGYGQDCPTTVEGQVDDYLKLIERMKSKGSLSQKVNVCFETEDKSKQQITLQLVIQKIFGEFLSLDCQYVNIKKFKEVLFKTLNKKHPEIESREQAYDG